MGSSSGGGNCETSEYASEVSEDYNSVDGSTSEARLVKDIDKYKYKHKKRPTQIQTQVCEEYICFML